MRVRRRHLRQPRVWAQLERSTGGLASAMQSWKVCSLPLLVARSACAHSSALHQWPSIAVSLCLTKHSSVCTAVGTTGLVMDLSSVAVEDIQPALGTLPLKDGAAKQSTPAAPKESLPENTKQTAPTASLAATPIPAQSHSGADKQEVLLISYACLSMLARRLAF